jgi:hypothetical protein
MPKASRVARQWSRLARAGKKELRERSGDLKFGVENLISGEVGKTFRDFCKPRMVLNSQLCC